MNDNDINWESIIVFLNQISEASRRTMERINFTAIEQAANAASSIAEKAINIDKMITSVSNTLRNHYERIDTIASLSSKMINGMAELQASVAVAASLYDSAMIDKVAQYVAALNVRGCIATIQDTVQKSSIIMPDYSFMKTSPLMKSIQSELSLPYGFATDIKRFNPCSAKQIANNKDIVFSCAERAFISGENKATTIEMNAVCTAVRLFGGISDDELFEENELIDFMSFLDQTPKLAITHPIGQRINKIINDITSFIGFDKDAFYHSRPRKKCEPPFVWGQMLKAPYGLPSVGRFNEIGQARFYFADTQDGSINEIRKHLGKSDSTEYTIQTVMISARNPVNLLDLSAKEMRGLNTFLKYLRIPFSTTSGNRPREYLIPQFVADCCYACGIDGIKYYGGKDYSNYVTWADGHFKYIRNLGDTDPQ